ncbi:MAG: ParB N-terminal domain-containing protein [Chromatiaceae bacterium]|nr:ParB N-terminal domain-containing protein [Chromatiaceae bacterium]
MEPLIVSLHPETLGHYLLVAGERRWRAAGMAGLATVAVIHAQHIEAPTRRFLCEFASRIGSRSLSFSLPRRWPGGLSEARRTGPRTRPAIGAWSPRCASWRSAPICRCRSARASPRPGVPASASRERPSWRRIGPNARRRPPKPSARRVTGRRPDSWRCPFPSTRTAWRPPSSTCWRSIATATRTGSFSPSRSMASRTGCASVPPPSKAPWTSCCVNWRRIRSRFVPMSPATGPAAPSRWRT